jgi:hypothetical protein
MPRIAGISREYQLALIDLMNDLLDTPHLDVDIAARARWLKLGLQGRYSAAELRLAPAG